MAINVFSKMPHSAPVTALCDGLVRRAVRLASVILLPLMLAACLSSKTPLFPATVGSTDLPAGKIESWSAKDGTLTRNDQQLEIRLEGSLYVASPDDKPGLFRLVAVGRDLYIVQYQEKSYAGTARDYYIVTREGDFWNWYAPDCALYLKAGMASLFDPPLTAETSSKCSVSSADSLRTIARKTLELQTPTSRFRLAP